MPGALARAHEVLPPQHTMLTVSSPLPWLQSLTVSALNIFAQIMDGFYHKGFALFNLKQYAEAVSWTCRMDV
eukprot:1159726-Pelagomonas_calceolata.AAC.2